LNEEVALQLQKEINKEAEETDHQIAMNVQRQLERQQRETERSNYFNNTGRRQSLGAHTNFPSNANLPGFSSRSSSIHTPSSNHDSSPQSSHYSPHSLPTGDIQYLLESLESTRNLHRTQERSNILASIRRRRAQREDLNEGESDLSYEQLTQLEDVKVGLSTQKINQFPEFVHKNGDKLDPCVHTYQQLIVIDVQSV